MENLIENNNNLDKIWRVEDIIEVFRECDDMFGTVARLVPIKISKRLTRAFGYYKYQICKQGDKVIEIIPVEFKFSASLLDGSYRKEDVLKIIKHEYVHFLTMDRTKEPVGHNNVFREYCEQIGAFSGAKVNIEPVVKLVKPEPPQKKYNIICTECGQIIEQKRAIRPDFFYNFHSGCCKADMTFELVNKPDKINKTTFKEEVKRLVKLIDIIDLKNIKRRFEFLKWKLEELENFVVDNRLPIDVDLIWEIDYRNVLIRDKSILRVIEATEKFLDDYTEKIYNIKSEAIKLEIKKKLMTVDEALSNFEITLEDYCCTYRELEEALDELREDLISIC